MDYKKLGLMSGFDKVYSGVRKTPTAGIVSVTIKNKGDLGSIREAEISFGNGKIFPGKKELQRKKKKILGVYYQISKYVLIFNAKIQNQFRSKLSSCHQECHIYLLFILSLAITLAKDKNFKKHLNYIIFFIINIAMVISIFYSTADANWKFHAQVGLDRLLYQTSGVYLIFIVSFFKNLKLINFKSSN